MIIKLNHPSLSLVKLHQIFLPHQPALPLCVPGPVEAAWCVARQRLNPSMLLKMSMVVPVTLVLTLMQPWSVSPVTGCGCGCTGWATLPAWVGGTTPGNYKQLEISCVCQDQVWSQLTTWAELGLDQDYFKEPNYILRELMGRLSSVSMEQMCFRPDPLSVCVCFCPHQFVCISISTPLSIRICFCPSFFALSKFKGSETSAKLIEPL